MSLRERNKLKCRARILKTSRKLFKEKGYEGTTIDEIAELSEISRGTFYNYFSDKESLLEGTAREEIDNLQEHLGKEISQDWEETLRKAMTFLILDARPNIALSKRIVCLAADPEGSLHPIENELTDHLREIVKQGEAKGALRKDVSPDDVVYALIGLYYVGIFQWGKEEEEKAVEKIEGALDLIIRGIKNE